MTEKKKPTGDYDVGYCRPPKAHQFPKKTSGNPGGAPLKKKQKRVDVAAVLNEPLAVKSLGVPRKMPPFEVAVRRLVERGLKQKNLNAILEFLELCKTHGLLVPPPVDPGGGVIIVPVGLSAEEWMNIHGEWVPASSLDADDEEID